MELAINLTRITFPFLFFICLASFFSAILNSHNKFAAASAAPIILNIVLILILFFSKSLGDQSCLLFILWCFISRFFTINIFI
jgi:putative peptidoglycan lipid II flippase